MTITATTRGILEQYIAEARAEQAQLDTARARLENELGGVLERLGAVSARVVDLEHDLALGTDATEGDELSDEPVLDVPADDDAEVVDPWA